MNIYIVLVITIILNSSANFLIKLAVTRVDSTQGIINQYLLNPFFIGGVIAFAISLFTYSYVLGRMKLSVAYPVITSACFIIVASTSWLYLKETISLIQLIGILMIISGIWLVLK